MMRPAGSPSSIRFLALLAVLVLVLVLVLVSRQTVMVGAANCNPLELGACAASIFNGTPPSGLCCSKLREQRPCLCGYIKNPSLKPYVSSPNARKVSSACGVPTPSC